MVEHDEKKTYIYLFLWHATENIKVTSMQTVGNVNIMILATEIHFLLK